ncbi:testis-expressed protein 48 [Ictidomys tridecemlineatus]
MVAAEASTETHQNLASKIFCSCCRYCEDTQASDDSKVPSQTQENQPSTVDLKLQKSELNRQNSKRMSTSLSLGKLLLYPQKKSSSSSTEFEGLRPPKRRDFPQAHQGLIPLPEAPRLGSALAPRGLGNLKKDQRGMQMTRTVAPSPPKRPSLTMLSSLLSELNAQDHQKGFYKRNLNRYSHEQWPYQSCLIGRP